MKSKKIFLKIIFGFAILIMCILIISLQIRIRKLEREKSSLEKEVEDYRITVEEMAYDYEIPREDYIEKYAREVLGYHKYSDTIIKEESD
jgi:cell division protein FtsB